MKIIFTTLTILIFSAFHYPLFTQEIPASPNPPRLVNDFTGTLAANEVESLESFLVSFNDSTSTQITVVLVNDLGNYTANQFAFEIGRKWGVGQKGKSNGLVVLVKPKSPGSKGQAAILVGYGLEDVVTDALCKRIIEVEMKPHFIEKDYYGGIVAATKVIMDVTKGRYTSEQYTKKTKKPSAVVGFVFFCVVLIIIIAVAGSKNKSQHHSIGSAGSNIPFWLLMGTLLGSSNRSGGSGGWSDFSSGGGGFGGFGGGDFGGGGASGSW